MQVGQIFLALGVKALGGDSIPAFVAGAKEAGRAASDAGKGMASADKHATSLHGRLKGLVGPINAARLELVAFVGTLTYLAQQASKVGAGLTQFENVTGLSAQRLQAWQQRAEMANVSADELASTVQRIQQEGVEISLGRGNIAPWALLGLDPRQDPFDVLNQLQGKLASMPAALGTKFASDIGLSPAMINFVKEMKGLPPARQELILSDAEIKRLKAFNIEFNRVWNAGKRALQQLGQATMPVASTAVWMIDRLGKALTFASKGTNELTDAFRSAAPFITATGVVLAAAFFPVTTAIVGLLLLLEDVMTWSRGGSSITGDLIGPFEKWRGTLQDIKDFIDGIKEALTALTDMSAEKIANWFTEVETATGAEGPQGAGIGSKIMRFVGSAVKAAGEWSGNAYQDIERGVTGMKTLYGMATGQQPVTMFNNTYNINGAQDPKAVADEIDRTNQNIMRGTQATMPIQ